jgi:vacuolar protein-sorting-associated protein 4
MDFKELAARTDGFSGSDIAVVVKDVLMQPIRLLKEATHFRKVRQGVCQRVAYCLQLSHCVVTARVIV